MKFKLSLLLGVAALLSVLAPRAAHADLGYWSKSLVGNWFHPVTRDLYIFKSNATYTRVIDKGNSKAVTEEGWWKIVQPTPSESGGSQEGPVALVLKARKSTTTNQVGDKGVTKKLKRDSRHVVDIIADGEKTNRDFYLFDGIKLERVELEKP